MVSVTLIFKQEFSLIWDCEGSPIYPTTVNVLSRGSRVKVIAEVDSPDAYLGPCPEAYLEPSPSSTMGLFCENNQRLLVVN